MRPAAPIRAKRAKRALVIMALTVAACRSPAPSLPAPAQAVMLRLQATESTVALAHSLARGFAVSRPDERVLAHITETTYAAALAIDAGSTAYTLVDSLPATSRLWAAPVARDRLVVITHPATGVSALNSGDLQALYAGRITNWATVGGADLPVTVISREPTSAGYERFYRAILEPYALQPEARLMTSYAAVQRLVASTPGALGYVPASSLTASVVPLTLPPPESAALETTLYITGPGEPEGLLREFIAWIQSPEGQAFVSQTYLPVFPQ